MQWNLLCELFFIFPVYSVFISILNLRNVKSLNWFLALLKSYYHFRRNFTYFFESNVFLYYIYLWLFLHCENLSMYPSLIFILLLTKLLYIFSLKLPYSFSSSHTPWSFHFFPPNTNSTLQHINTSRMLHFLNGTTFNVFKCSTFFIFFLNFCFFPHLYNSPNVLPYISFRILISFATIGWNLPWLRLLKQLINFYSIENKYD